MARWLPAALAASLLVSLSTLIAAPPGIELVAIGAIPGNLLDKSGLTGVICQAGNPGQLCPEGRVGRTGVGPVLYRS